MSAGACLALLLGCGKSEQNPAFQFATGQGGVSAVGGSPSNTGGAGVSASGAGASGSGGAAGECGVNDPSSCVTDAPPAPVPSALVGDIAAQVMSDGCGKNYESAKGTKRTLLTQGTKAPDCADRLDGKHQCGDWTVRRDFIVYIPPNYDSQKPYQLVIEAPGCGGNAGAVFNFGGDAANKIRVGISPGPNSTGHPTAPDLGCFDDSEGDDSIDWVFYERLYDTLNTELCFDRRRVFVYGQGNGGSLANELGCKYGSDTVRPVRGILDDEASVPAPQYLPTCNQSALAEMWVFREAGGDYRVEDKKLTIARAMAAAQCPGGDYDHAQLEAFPIGGGKPDDICQHIVGCAPLYPLVVCVPNVGQQQGLTSVTQPGFSTFTKQFASGPLAPPPQ